MTSLLVLQQVRAVDPARQLDAVVDIVIERGRIIRIGRGAASELSPSEHVKFVRGPLTVFPGFIDLHTHLREPGHEYKEDIASGLKAAAHGGFVAVCSMPNTKPVNDRRSITDAIVARAKEVGGTRLHPIGAVTVGSEGHKLADIGDMRLAGAVAISDDGRCVTSSSVMRHALEYARTFDMPVIQHAEDHALTEGAQMNEGAVSTRIGLRGWPRVAEDIIVARDVLLAEATGARYHVAHVSTHGAVRILREAKSRGIRVTAEVTPHHLLLTDESVIGYNTACKVNPPLRLAEDVAALREALADGTIDCIATDHAPHSGLEKDCEFSAAAPGMLGLELCVPLLYGFVLDGTLRIERFVDALSQAPAGIVSLERPTLAEGARADITVIDPEARWHIDPSKFRSKSKNTPFAGREVRGRVTMTIVGGNVAFEFGS